MAVTFFSKQIGQVAAFTDPTMPSRALVRMEGWSGFPVLRSVITQLTVASQANLQFLHTLGGNIFIYSFGDRIGQMTINGLCFDTACEEPSNLIGIERVVKFYNQNRAANRQTPMKITIGSSTTLTGYLAGIRFSIADPKTRVWEYSLQFATIPASKKRKALADKPAGGGSSDSGDSGDSGSGGGAGDTYPDFDDSYLTNLDSGGAVGDVTGSAAVAAGLGYSAYGTGPNTQLVKSRV